MEKYIFVKKDIVLKNNYGVEYFIPKNNIYKVLNQNGNVLTLAGKATRESSKSVLLYDVEKSMLNKDNSVGLDEFFEENNIIFKGKRFFRTADLDKTVDAPGVFMALANKSTSVLLVYSKNNGFVYLDENRNRVYILGKDYLEDGNFKLLNQEVELGNLTSAENVKKHLISQLEKEIYSSLYFSKEF